MTTRNPAQAKNTSWRDTMLPGSFRGVPFGVQTTDGEIGRRTVVHQYPYRDLPFAEDLGRKARTFDVQAVVIGDGYMQVRDKLTAALEQPGTGELIHPWRGRQQVVVMSAKLSESSAEGGMARFCISFSESGAALNPAPKIDTGSKVKNAADKAAAATKNSFANKFFSGLKGLVTNVSSALATVNSALNSINQAANSILSSVLMPEWSLSLTGIQTSLTSLMMFPANLAFGIYAQISSLAGIATGPEAAFQALVSLFNFGGTAFTVSPSTPGKQQQAINHDAVVNLVRQASVIEAARVATQITPVSYNDAMVLQNTITAQIDNLTLTIDDDNVFFALTDLRIAVIQDITARAADLSRIVQYQVPITMPALVIAYRLYQDAAQADRIVARNHIANPLFVPGGQSLEVLTP